jgi:aldehyde:ferredoxin oxidoreductase
MSTLHGKIMDVDLSSGSITTRTIDKKILNDYIGGSGLAARLFVDDGVPVDCDPLGPENNLYILTGPLTGSGLPATPRFSVAAKSPLTGIWGEANCGGYFGPALKFAGWDGIVVRGQSKKPVILFINDEKAELVDASDIWGEDTYDVVDILEKKFEGTPNVRVISIGKGGENLVKFANIADGNHDFAGRTGLGAVMGSKKLKAVAARGSGKLTPADPDDFNDLRKLCAEKVKNDLLAISFNQFGLNVSMTAGAATGDIPMKNWAVGVEPTTDLCLKLDSNIMNAKYLTKSSGCYGCSVACKRNVKVDEGPYKTDEIPGPEYETMSSFGTMCLIEDQPAIYKMTDLVNRYGIDSISCGSTIAFAIDCYESGILTDADTDGLKLTWGNAEAIIELIEKIANRDGIGDMLAEGSRSAAKKIGKGAEDLTAEIKGLEAPMHEPRTYHGLALAYAMSIRGACHLSHTMLFMEEKALNLPEVGLVASDDFIGQTSEGKGKLTKVTEDLAMMMQCMGMCYLPAASYSIDDILRMFKTTAGLDLTLDDLLTIGERIWLLKRSLNNLMGITAKDDVLPKKLLTPLKEGLAAGSVPDMDLMMKDYYSVRELDDRGFPKKDKLVALGLADIAKKLHG